VFEKSDRRIYQATTYPVESADSVRVVKQKEAYPRIPYKPTFKIWQLQYSLYSTTLHLGMDVTARGQHAHEQAARHEFALGVFIPIQTGETTLLFMLQVRWTNADQSRSFTFGFSLSASIPGFVTKDKTADKK